MAEKVAVERNLEVVPRSTIVPRSTTKITSARRTVASRLFPEASGEPDSPAVQLLDWDPDQLGRFVGYLPQEPSVFRKMTTAQNILAVLETTGLRRREQLKRLEELLEEFGIAHVRNTRGDALSGGERRRTCQPKAVRPT